MATNKITPADIEVRRIKDFAFFVNESMFDQEKIQTIEVRFQHKLDIMQAISFTLRTVFIYPGVDDLIADLHVENVFAVNNLEQYSDGKGGYNLPHDLLAIIVGESVSHSRALFQKNIAGTAFQGLNIPMVDAIQMTQSLFPDTTAPSKEYFV
ncbi:hypothetical protein [Deminuibacter soli]|uniref:Uncharacterized protein n=1 Tax=Deminuibacter soli TaxID=2291815 RepID=A0A3E1NEA2_9BACT|nr:hypothetical protein [Deminuibacter soli]RFM26197.1 hypothetical protein DXN05_21620 [Deminuibacter soli]